MKKHIIHLTSGTGKVVKTLIIQAESINEALYDVLGNYSSKFSFYAVEWVGFANRK
jgi:hypothetical protein